MAYSNRGIAYTEGKGRYDEAIYDFSIAIDIDPTNADTYNYRGYAYDRKNQNDRAISDYNKAIILNPQHVDAYINRGISYGTRGQNDRACSDMKRACELGFCEHYDKAKNDGTCQ